METKELLEKVVRDRLEKTADKNMSEEEKQKAFEEAMKATDRFIEIGKLESDKDKKLNRIIKFIEVIAVPVALMTVDFLFKMRYTRTVCEFEKDYTFTTQAGRSISQFFKFKK